MKAKLAAAALVAFSVATTAANAAVFHTRAAFDSSVSKQAIATFDGVAEPTYYVEYPFLAPYVESGMTFIGAGNMLIIDQDYYSNAAYEGGGFLTNQGDPGAFLVQFASTKAIGFNFGGLFGSPVGWTVTLSNGEVYETGASSTDIYSSASLGFFGLASDTPFSWALIDTPRGSPVAVGVYYYNAMDNFTIGVAGVPEPSTWALMIAGFGLAGAVLRRRGAVLRHSYLTLR